MVTHPPKVAAALYFWRLCFGRNIYLLPQHRHDRLDERRDRRLHRLDFYDECRNIQIQETVDQLQTEIATIYFSFLLSAMLWEFKLTFSGYIDAPASLVEARKALALDMKTNPERYISGMRPVEPTNTTFVELGKRVLGLA